MLPALGLDWNEEYGELSEMKKSSNVIVQPNEWSWETVWSTGHNQDEKYHSDSVMDDNGDIHFAFLEHLIDNDYEIKYAKYDGESWSVSTPDPIPITGALLGHISIDVDSLNNPKIVK